MSPLPRREWKSKALQPRDVLPCAATAGGLTAQDVLALGSSVPGRTLPGWTWAPCRSCSSRASSRPESGGNAAAAVSWVRENLLL